MKVLIVCDVPNWAIGQLSKVIEKENLHLNIKIIYIHPKDLRRDMENYKGIFENEVKTFNPDVIHFQYWGTCEHLSGMDCCKDKKLILTHHNQKNLNSADWSNLDTIVCHTEKAKKELQELGYWNVEVIQHGIDIEKFKFNENYDYKNKTLGYVGRVCRWKNLLPILKVAKKLGTKVIIQGKPDKPDYWKECLEYEEQMDIRFNTPDEKQTEVYHEMGCYVGNSRDDLEEGTLGFLEALSCGVPVITTLAGEARDLAEDGKNMIVIDFENEKSLEEGIKRFWNMTDKEKDTMRNNGWNTVKNLNKQRMARQYEKLYYRIGFKNDLVSIIIPTYNRSKSISKVLDGYKRQTYQPIEIIVVDDNSKDETKDVIFEWALENKDIPIKYLNTNYNGYGLAKARNIGIFEATGNYIIFSDDRYIPYNSAVDYFVSALKNKKNPTAVWGDKGAGKRDFMENFFIIRKKDIANAGMFNERINQYGGQSQEIRERFRNLGYNLQFEPMAKADVVFGTHNKTQKKYEIFNMKLKLWRLKN